MVSYVTQLHVVMVLASLFSVVACIGLIRLTGIVNLRLKREDHWVHMRQTPRLGGMAILSTLLILIFFVDTSIQTTTFKLLFSVFPLFICGLLEDVGIKVKPIYRILFGCIAGMLAVGLLGAWLSSIHLPFIDVFLAVPAIGIMFSVLGSNSLAHSYNLIDGLNGLSSGIGLLALCLISLVAAQNGERVIAITSLLFASAVFGFWVLNILTGRIFLGDSGAYFIGHTVAWLSILLCHSHNAISPWAMLLGTAYPLTELCITIFRRLKAGRSLVEPDKGHLHHLIYDLTEKWLKLPRTGTNCLASLATISIASVSTMAAYIYSSRSIICAILMLVFFVSWAVLYLKLKPTTLGRS